MQVSGSARLAIMKLANCATYTSARNSWIPVRPTHAGLCSSAEEVLPASHWFTANQAGGAAEEDVAARHAEHVAAGRECHDLGAAKAHWAPGI
mmetsp:Transcript_73374/g.118374  ORF Transcript_73374/g.118374 Transcript_73374/m.118374 type:complete len:93 (+) Transcript_73374:221-499(+)